LLRALPVIHVVSAAILLFSLAFLVPMGFSLALADGAMGLYVTGFTITAFFGLMMFVATRGQHRRELSPRDGFLLVALVWTVVPAFAGIPLLAGIPELSVTDAYFEATSGLTATGATLISGLDHLPPSLNIWRALLHWLGGMGIIVLAVAILPLLGVGGSQLFKAEFPGAMKDTKLTPRIGDQAKGLWGVYVLFTAACIVALHMAGMDWVDATAHAFSVMALGGFSTKDASIGHFDSPAIEAVLVVFMLVAAINFATHFLAFRQRSPWAYARDVEARRVVGWLAASVAGMTAYLLASGTVVDFGSAFRQAAFQVVSIATTTGFATVDYGQWPAFAGFWLVFLSAISSSSGSTGGGIKMIRAELLVRQTFREMTRIIHPSAVLPVKLGAAVIENNVIFAVLAYMLMYGGTLIVMTMVLLASGLDPVTAFSAVFACINNLGPGLGAVGPASNYAVLTDFQTWVCTLTMLLGRLELFTLVVLVTPAFWRK
jgi:trk system potassium uptake protein TrkH